MNATDPNDKDDVAESEAREAELDDNATEGRPKEIGGRKGPDPTRYGDWEKGGRCIDF